uniref:Bee-milk protein n=1 Tax=Graphocephala atropunctata TaxID=36148 RepID=A0A1B6ML25_9HEMI
MNAQCTEYIHSRTLMVRDDNLTLKVIDISGTPVLSQTFYGVTEFEVSPSKLLTHEGPVYRVYTLQEGEYREIFQTGRAVISTALSIEFFSFSKFLSANVQVVDLVTLEEFGFIPPAYIISMSILVNILNVVYCKPPNDYGLSRYDLKKRLKLHDFDLCSTNYIFHPDISSDLVVYQYRSDVCVKSVKGDLLTTLADSDLIAVDGKYVVYQTISSRHELHIWNCKTPDGGSRTLQLGSSEDFHKHLISGSLLVLSYKGHFKVIDIHEATILYEVEVESLYTNSLIPIKSEFYYVLPYVTTTPSFTTPAYQTPIKIFLEVYDFTGKVK